MKVLSRGMLLVLALSVGTAQRAAAQASDYPTKPVTFIVPFAPGGVTSLFARVLGQRLEQRLGKPFVIENRPGGGGVTAAAAVASAATASLR
jgi:tripartite-type tricarboxylate transporter receptor subunit TctC